MSFVGTDWQDQAACSDAPSTFDLAGDGNRWGIAKAVRICRTECPVTTECLLYQLAIEGDIDHRHRWGVWGGLTPLERQRVARGATLTTRGARR